MRSRATSKTQQTALFLSAFSLVYFVGCTGADPCTVEQSGTTAVIRCPDGTSAVVADGTDGMDGAEGMGVAGTDGSDCSVLQIGASSAVIECTDGSTATVFGGLPHATVSLGDDFGCSLSRRGEIDCWGSEVAVVDNVPAGTFVELVTGMSSACALRTDGTATCWGQAAEGRGAPPADVRFKSIEILGNVFHRVGCGLRASDSVAVCWGFEIGGTPPPSVAFDQLACGGYFCCGFEAGSAELSCSGSYANTSGTLPPDAEIAVLRLGEQAVCATDDAGALSCTLSAGWEPPVLAGDIRQFDVYINDVCGIDSTGAILCDTKFSGAPVTGSYRSISVGYYAACAVDSGDQIVCWGTNLAVAEGP